MILNLYNKFIEDYIYIDISSLIAIVYVNNYTLKR